MKRIEGWWLYSDGREYFIEDWIGTLNGKCVKLSGGVDCDSLIPERLNQS